MDSIDCMNAFIVKKKKFKIIDFFFLLFLFVFALWTLKAIAVFVIFFAFFVWQLYDILKRCMDEISFIKITNENISFFDKEMHHDMVLYKWNDLKRISVKKISMTRAVSFYLEIETIDDKYYSICLDSFDISPKTLKEHLKKTMPKVLLENFS